MRVLFNVSKALILLCLVSGHAWAFNQFEFRKTYESKEFTKNPIALLTTADLNGNGLKEVVATDFSLVEGKDIDRAVTGYNLYILEWRNKQIDISFRKKWNALGPQQEQFMAFKVVMLAPWEVNGHASVEALPPYFGVEWRKNRYVINEQVWGPEYNNSTGSWALPWISPACYDFGRGKGPQWNVKAPPRECLMGIRDLMGDGHPVIVSLLEEEVIKDREYRHTLRIRSFKGGFPIEWHTVNRDRFLTWSLSTRSYPDLLNWHVSDKLMLYGFKNSKWYLLERDERKKDFVLSDTEVDKPLDVKAHSLPYLYLGASQEKHAEEYFGYHFIKGPDNRDIAVLGKDRLRSDLKGFDYQNIDFEHHEPFIGVSYFDVNDVDGDGIDEIILVERDGKRKYGEDTIIYSNVKEYIHILKWNGEKYQIMWVSPPYTKIGTKFLVDDIKNTGKKQLVVLTPYGAIQVWERQ